MISKDPGASRARLISAALLSMGALPSAGFAGTVTGPNTVVTVGTNDPREAWSVSDRATLIVDGGATDRITATSGSILRLTRAQTTAATTRFSAALLVQNGATATIDGSTITDTVGRAMTLQLSSTMPVAPPSAQVTASQLKGMTDGILMSGGGTLGIGNGSSVEGTASTAGGVRISNGDVTIAGGSSIKGGLSGIIVTDDTRGSEDRGRTLSIDHSSIEGVNGAAILVDPQGRTKATVANITLANGTTLKGGNGIAVETAANTQTQLTIDNSAIDGDMVSHGGGFDIVMQGGASVAGRMQGIGALSLNDGSSWRISGDSDVGSLSLSNATIQFQPRSTMASPDAAPHSRAVIHGDLSGQGGAVRFNTVMNAGGGLAAQSTDRLLIEGNVTTTGPTLVDVTPTGDGADTDLNGNRLTDANEGISLIQVGGSSRADAFALRGGYVAVGGYQYILHAFGPGQADTSQSLLPGGALNWDYRLATRLCTGSGCEPVGPEEPGGPEVPVDPGTPVDPGKPVDPGTPGPGPGPFPPGERVAVAPQLPSYLSAPAALLNYGDMLNDGLRQRLGDIRQGQLDGPVGGEVFARYLGGQLRYASNRSFANYGYDFDQQINALQLGGSLMAKDMDGGMLRFGWAADHGTTRVSPKAVDGNSSAKYRASGLAGWVTWQSNGGWWIDGVIANQRFRGDVNTDMRGSDVARIRARGNTLSIESGMPFAIGAGWTLEPQVQLKYQTLDFDDFTDADGLTVSLGSAKQTSARVGMLVSRTADPIFAPYGRLDLVYTGNGDPSADVASEAWNVRDTFGSGRVGNATRITAGATSQLASNVQLYGEGTYQHFVGSYGLRGWAGNVGLRVTF